MTIQRLSIRASATTCFVLRSGDNRSRRRTRRSELRARFKKAFVAVPQTFNNCLLVSVVSGSRLERASGSVAIARDGSARIQFKMASTFCSTGRELGTIASENPSRYQRTEYSRWQEKSIDTKAVASSRLLLHQIPRKTLCLRVCKCLLRSLRFCPHRRSEASVTY